MTITPVWVIFIIDTECESTEGKENMKTVKYQMPLKNEDFTGYSETEFCDYELNIGDSENAENAVRKEIREQSTDPNWPFKIISVSNMPEVDGVL